MEPGHIASIVFDKNVINIMDHTLAIYTITMLICGRYAPKKNEAVDFFYESPFFREGAYFIKSKRFDPKTGYSRVVLEHVEDINETAQP
jgi:hypothetical protein